MDDNDKQLKYLEAALDDARIATEGQLYFHVATYDTEENRDAVISRIQDVRTGVRVIDASQYTEEEPAIVTKLQEEFGAHGYPEAVFLTGLERHLRLDFDTQARISADEAADLDLKGVFGNANFHRNMFGDVLGGTPLVIVLNEKASRLFALAAPDLYDYRQGHFDLTGPQCK